MTATEIEVAADWSPVDLTDIIERLAAEQLEGRCALEGDAETAAEQNTPLDPPPELAGMVHELAKQVHEIGHTLAEALIFDRPREIVEVLACAEPLSDGDGGDIVAWAMDRSGATHPILVTATNPQPTIRRST